MAPVQEKMRKKEKEEEKFKEEIQESLKIEKIEVKPKTRKKEIEKDESLKIEVQTREKEILQKEEKEIKKVDHQLKRLIFRASIWRAYNRKCLYCGDLISRLENMEVDHIIPQKYKSQPEKFERIKEGYELQADFDIDAYYNRVPSDKGCNVKKSDHLYPKEQTSFYLSEAKLKVPKIEEYERKYKKDFLISDEMLNGEINLEKLNWFYEKMGVINDKEPIQVEEINERALENHIKAFNDNLEIIREKGSGAFEWRYYKIREEAMKVYNHWNQININLPIIDELIKLMDVFINEVDENLRNWGIDILNLLATAPTLLQIIIEKCYDQLISHYKPSILNQQLVDILDKFGYFPDDTIPEIIKMIREQNVNHLNCFKHRLYNKKLTITGEKRQDYINEITLATMDLEPKTNQTHNTIMGYSNEVKELLNRIE